MGHLPHLPGLDQGIGATLVGLDQEIGATLVGLDQGIGATLVGPVHQSPMHPEDPDQRNLLQSTLGVLHPSTAPLALEAILIGRSIIDIVFCKCNIMILL